MKIISHFINNFNEQHKQAVKYILCYLKGIINHKLIYTKNNSNHLIKYNNLNYINDVNTHQNIVKYVFYLIKSLIIYKLNYIKTITLLIIEIEYITLCTTV